MGYLQELSLDIGQMYRVSVSFDCGFAGSSSWWSHDSSCRWMARLPIHLSMFCIITSEWWPCRMIRLIMFCALVVRFRDVQIICDGICDGETQRVDLASRWLSGVISMDWWLRPDTRITYTVLLVMRHWRMHATLPWWRHCCLVWYWGIRRSMVVHSLEHLEDAWVGCSL